MGGAGIGMEIVLLWLDDLDDLVFCCARMWEPVRRLCLQIGLAASIALGTFELGARAEWTAALTWVAAGSVIVWLSGGVCTAAARLKLSRRPALA